MSAHNHQAAHLNECSTASPSMVTLVGIDIDNVLSGHQVPVARNDAPAPMARQRVMSCGGGLRGCGPPQRGGARLPARRPASTAAVLSAVLAWGMNRSSLRRSRRGNIGRAGIIISRTRI